MCSCCRTVFQLPPLPPPTLLCCSAKRCEAESCLKASCRRDKGFLYSQTGSEGRSAAFCCGRGVGGGARVRAAVWHRATTPVVAFVVAFFMSTLTCAAAFFFFFPALSRSRLWPRLRRCRVSSNLPSPSSQRGHNAEWVGHQVQGGVNAPSGGSNCRFSAEG